MSIAPHERAPARRDQSLKQRYDDVRKRVEEAATRSGRRSDRVILVAVTKYASIDQVRQLIEMGHVDLGESKVQNLIQRAAQIEEFMERHRQLNRGRKKTLPEQVRWHMVGHLQRNKVRKLLNVVRLIHSVDSLRLAEEIQSAAARREDPIEVLIQVNMSGEKSKYGVAPAAARHLIEQMETMINLKPRGLMGMGPLVDDAGEIRRCFEQCRELFDDICKIGVVSDSFDILSMGMSRDFETAIECGANIVRVGSAIFGKQEEDEDDGDGD